MVVQSGWHVTPAANLDAIRKDGLRPQVGPRAARMTEPLEAIYLFPEIEDVETALGGWMGDEFADDEKLALLHVRLPPGVPLWSDAGYEMAIGSAIAPDQLTIITDDLDNAVDLFEREERSGDTGPAP